LIFKYVFLVYNTLSIDAQIYCEQEEVD
jgi:hypothetical protein